MEREAMTPAEHKLRKALAAMERLIDDMAKVNCYIHELLDEYEKDLEGMAQGLDNILFR